MRLFCTDIDNTLIYSHRKPLRVPRRIAEYLNGKEQAYIPAGLYELIAAHTDKFTVIPVTMRTPEQYGRIFVLEGICRYARCKPLLQEGRGMRRRCSA